jgi:hypothetical protein
VLIVSEFLLEKLGRVLRYPRLRRVHLLDDQKIDRALATIETVSARVAVRERDVLRVVPHDPDDDHVVAAVGAGADVHCTRNRHLYHEAVIAYCREHGVEIMDDIRLLARLRRAEEESATS